MKIQESFLPSCYVCHVCLLKESEGDFDEPIEVDEDDEKAISVFMNQNPPVRQTLADVILEKIRDKKTELSTVMTGSVAPSIITKHNLLHIRTCICTFAVESGAASKPQMDDRVVTVFKRYKLCKISH